MDCDVLEAYVAYDDGAACENCVRLLLNEDLGEASERRGHRTDNEIASFERERDLLAQGIEILDQIEDPNEDLQRLTNMGKFMYRTVLTAINRKRYYKLDQLRMKAAEEKDAAAHRDAVDGMLDILQHEKQNAIDTIPLVEFDSVLGYEPSIEYVTDRYRLEWKLNQVDEEAAKLRAETI